MKQKIQNELQEALKYNLSFAGCGFLGIYHVGVAVCFKKFAPQLLLQKISGASAGALAATCLLVDLPLGEMTSDFFRVVNEARSHSLGPFSPSFDIQTCLLEGMSKFLPEDAHLKVNGKLHISLTRVYDGKSVIVSQFNSREDLLDALLCACFIPGFSGIIPPKFHGVRYMDGAFSDNLPTLDENTVTVSPFCGESDIAPRDNSPGMFHVNLANTSIELSRQNIYRFIRILFPPKPEILSNMCQQGFDDALHFLHRNHLISCTRCLAIQSTFILSNQTPEHYDPECTTCSYHRDESLVDKSMPESVLSVMEKYIMNNTGSGLFKWFRKPALFVCRFLSIPAIPCDYVYATLSKILATAPTVKNNIWELTQYVLDNLFYLLLPWDGNSEEMDVYSNQIREMYETDPILKKFDHVGPRKSIADIYPSDYEYNNESDFEVRGNVLSRRSSSVHSLLHLHAQNNSQSKSELETLENLSHSASQHNTLYSYHYYSDENDKTMKFNKIFDMTDSDAASIALSETETNQMLQYDELFNHDDNESLIQQDVALLLPETKEIMSDWTCAEIKIDEINSENVITSDDRTSSVESMDSFYKPEADQSEHEQQNLMSENVIDVLNKDTKNYTILASKDCNEE